MFDKLVPSLNVRRTLRSAVSDFLEGDLGWNDISPCNIIGARSFQNKDRTPSSAKKGVAPLKDPVIPPAKEGNVSLEQLVGVVASPANDTINAKRIALSHAVIGNMPLLGNIPVRASSPGSVGGAGPNIRWMETLRENFHFPEISLKHIISGRLGTLFPIICCINNKDISNEDNWKACILKKIRKDQFELLDQHERDKVDEDIELEGDDGLRNSWTLYL
jgi:hypothetical protein